MRKKPKEDKLKARTKTTPGKIVKKIRKAESNYLIKKEHEWEAEIKISRKKNEKQTQIQLLQLTAGLKLYRKKNGWYSIEL